MTSAWAALCLLGLLLSPGRAEALDQVSGEGFGYVVPTTFLPAPRAMRDATEKMCVELGTNLPIRFKGRPTFRMFIVPESPQVPEAYVASYAFTLDPGQSQPALSTTTSKKIEAGLLRGLNKIPDLRSSGSVTRTIGGGVHASVTTMSYERKVVGERILRVGLSVRKHVACLVIMESPASKEGVYRMHWDGVIGSLRLGIQVDQAGAMLRYLPIFGVGLGILVVLAFAWTSHRRRRATSRVRAIEELGFRANTISELKGSRAVDGLDIFDQEEPPPREPSTGRFPALTASEAQPPVEEAALAIDALDFDIPERRFNAAKEQVNGAGMATATGGAVGPRKVAARAAPTATPPMERKVLRADPNQREGGPIRIVRNDEYLAE